MEGGSGRQKTMGKKNRKSGSTILYLIFTTVQQGTRRMSTMLVYYIKEIKFLEVTHAHFGTRV